MRDRLLRRRSGAFRARIASSVSSRPGSPIAPVVRVLDSGCERRAVVRGVAGPDQRLDDRPLPERAMIGFVEAEIGEADDFALVHRNAAENLRQIFAKPDPRQQLLGLAEPALARACGRRRRRFPGSPRHRWRARRGRGRRVARPRSSRRRAGLARSLSRALRRWRNPGAPRRQAGPGGQGRRASRRVLHVRPCCAAQCVAAPAVAMRLFGVIGWK